MGEPQPPRLVAAAYQGRSDAAGRTLVCTSQPDQISSSLSWTIPQLPGDPGATAQGVADGSKAILFRLASVGVPGLGQRAYEARWSGP